MSPADFCPHFIDDVCLLSWHCGFREGQRNLRCAKCQRSIAIKRNGEYQPWGESNDSPPAVRIEILGARFAADYDRPSKAGPCPFGECDVCQARHLAELIRPTSVRPGLLEMG